MTDATDALVEIVRNTLLVCERFERHFSGKSPRILDLGLLCELIQELEPVAFYLQEVGADSPGVKEIGSALTNARDLAEQAALAQQSSHPEVNPAQWRELATIQFFHMLKGRDAHVEIASYEGVVLTLHYMSPNGWFELTDCAPQASRRVVTRLESPEDSVETRQTLRCVCGATRELDASAVFERFESQRLLGAFYDELALPSSTRATSVD
ncbi:MAG: hypothetical protein U0271_38985 [Polyangiaceae bacterium]